MKIHKKLENFLYYYKYHLLIIIFLIIVSFMFFKDLIKKPSYDYTIAIITSDAISEASLSLLNSFLCTKGYDINSDDTVKINLVNYVLSDGSNANQTTIGLTQFISDWNTADSMIYIYSDDVYNKYKDENIFNVNSNKTVKLNSFLSDISSELNELNISLRIFDRTSSSFNNEKFQYYLNCKKLYENIIE